MVMQKIKSIFNNEWRREHIILPLMIRGQTWGRNYLIGKNHSLKMFTPQPNLHRRLWNLTFQLPLMNSAGLYKSGDAYNRTFAIGAGGYVGGTSTFNERRGNYKDGVRHPVLALFKSRVCINYLGLPNKGDKYLSRLGFTANKSPTCPIGWSVARSPDFDEKAGLAHLVEGMWLYHNNQQIDYLELNESCPNVAHGAGDLVQRLEFVASKFLAHRSRPLPVVVKFSNDLDITKLPEIIKLLIRLRFDGIILGNTSTNYAAIRPMIHPKEVKYFDLFIRKFGGGVSGTVLKQTSLALCTEAVRIVRQIAPVQEFHVIRSGGIDSYQDILDSDAAGVSLNQWFSGFLHQYSVEINDVYRTMFNGNL